MRPPRLFALLLLVGLLTSAAAGQEAGPGQAGTSVRGGGAKTEPGTAVAFLERGSVGIMLQSFALRNLPTAGDLRLVLPLGGDIELRWSMGYAHGDFSPGWTPLLSSESFIVFDTEEGAMLDHHLAVVWLHTLRADMSVHAGAELSTWFYVHGSGGFFESVRRASLGSGIMRPGLLLGVSWYPHERWRIGAEYQFNYVRAAHPHDRFGWTDIIRTEIGSFDVPVALSVVFKPF